MSESHLLLSVYLGLVLGVVFYGLFTAIRILHTLRHIAGLLNSLGEMIGDAIEAQERTDPARNERG